MGRDGVKVFFLANAVGRFHRRSVDFHSKLIPLPDLPAWRRTLRDAGRRLVVTNGCFDLLHLGHVTYLQRARDLGDVLLIGVNSDAAVRELKGPDRPINPEQDRALVLAALESVSAVSIFTEKRAVNFLLAAQPDVYVKGGDYTLATIDQDERRAVESAGGVIEFIPFVTGRSTTATLQRMTKAG